ncbi:hypothetical protein L6V77_12350 [Myxococcota bacterium]|nr:hypothetical protein [Myxococcota bacterium]
MGASAPAHATVGYRAVKVFTATKAAERERLGDLVTEWLAAHPEVELVDTVVQQSSDQQFHCLTIVVFYRVSMP